MPIQSDMTLDATRFHSDNTPEDMRKLYSDFMENVLTWPRPWEVGFEKFRAMSEEGTTGWPAPVHLPGGVDEEIPSRESGRPIPVRVFRPGGGVPTKGIFLHFHPGGWIANTHRDFDELLKNYADGAQVTVVSVGYRLAPEHLFPAGPEDCFDAADFVVSHGAERFGNGAEQPLPPLFLGGESAGAHLAVLTTFQLIPKLDALGKPAGRLIAGLVLSYGVYELTTGAFIEHFLGPDLTSIDARRSPNVSPLFDNLEQLAALAGPGGLPPALFFCGGGDTLVDDTVRMAAKWMGSGSETIVKIFPGAPHGFDLFRPGGTAAALEMRHLAALFVREKTDQIKLR